MSIWNKVCYDCWHHVFEYLSEDYQVFASFFWISKMTNDIVSNLNRLTFKRYNKINDEITYRFNVIHGKPYDGRITLVYKYKFDKLIKYINKIHVFYRGSSWFDMTLVMMFLRKNKQYGGKIVITHDLLQEIFIGHRYIYPSKRLIRLLLAYKLSERPLTYNSRGRILTIFYKKLHLKNTIITDYLTDFKNNGTFYKVFYRCEACPIPVKFKLYKHYRKLYVCGKCKRYPIPIKSKYYKYHKTLTRHNRNYKYIAVYINSHLCKRDNAS